MKYKAPLGDINFALYEVLNYRRHLENLAAGEIAEEQVAIVLDEAARFAELEIAPLNAIGDHEGCKWRDGRVITPPGFKDAYNAFVTNGWPTLSHETSRGGQGLPHSIYCVLYELLNTANHSWAMYPGLSSGAIRTIEAHGTEEQKSTFLPHLIDGRWSAAMCLTEAQCGSDLSLLRTRAEPVSENNYAITGTKTFISSGEHDLTENIIYLTLARLPDAPRGIKGISLLIVPKFLPGSDHSPGVRNQVSCSSIEQKMGLHGNSTCTIDFDTATGFLLGQANQGLNAMFTFINESRLNVAMQGLAAAEKSHQGSVNYATERRQMRAHPRRLPEMPADPIIAHPDVRRMLLTQKVFAEGGRMLIYYCSMQVDIARSCKHAEVRKAAEDRLALLTPIAKGFLSEVGVEAANLGIQILGGYGFIAGSGMEQVARDVRITTIYEGTNGIQALDLLARKLLGGSHELLSSFTADILAFCQENEHTLRSKTDSLQGLTSEWHKLIEEVRGKSLHDPNATGSAAFDHLMFSGYVTLAYFWAQAALAAHKKLSESHSENAFCRTKLATADYYFDRVLPRARLHAELVRCESSSLMSLKDREFSAGS